ncbi:MAG: hypothetical protein Q4C55_01740 [Eubacterium sp.]|nr:hypothetical protein [Eubacterium sp.]
MATFGVALIFQMLITHEINTNTMILSCFFVGIKILLLGICDITGIGRHIIVALLFIVIADCIAFAINFLMVFGLSSRLLLTTLVVDAVIVALSHIIWSRRFGGKHSEKRERKAWLNERDIEREDEGYEDIFENVSGKKDGAKAEVAAVAAEKLEEEEDDFADLFGDDDEEDFDTEEEFDYADEEALPDYEEDDIDEEDYDEDEALFDELPESRDGEEADDDDFDDDDAYLDEEAFKSLLINDDDLVKMEDAMEAPEAAQEAEDETAEAAETVEDEAAQEVEVPQAEAEEEAADTVQEEEEVQEAEEAPAVEEVPEEAPEEESVADTAEKLPALDELLGTEDTDGNQTESAKDFTEIEARLGALLEEINATTEETGKLEKTVTDFKAELDQLTPITKDTDIIETGDVIREKLKNIINKQFIVDDVLDDLTRLSGQISKRIDDLDAIEADLNRRTEILDKKEFLFMTRKNAAEADVQVKNEEVLLENEESEIIIDQEDLEKIKAYLKEHPEL